MKRWPGKGVLARQRWSRITASGRNGLGWNNRRQHGNGSGRRERREGKEGVKGKTITNCVRATI